MFYTNRTGALVLTAALLLVGCSNTGDGPALPAGHDVQAVDEMSDAELYAAWQDHLVPDPGDDVFAHLARSEELQAALERRFVHLQIHDDCRDATQTELEQLIAALVGQGPDPSAQLYERYADAPTRVGDLISAAADLATRAAAGDVIGGGVDIFVTADTLCIEWLETGVFGPDAADSRARLAAISSEYDGAAPTQPAATEAAPAHPAQITGTRADEITKQLTRSLPHADTIGGECAEHDDQVACDIVVDGHPLWLQVFDVDPDPQFAPDGLLVAFGVGPDCQGASGCAYSNAVDVAALRSESARLLGVPDTTVDCDAGDTPSHRVPPGGEILCLADDGSTVVHVVTTPDTTEVLEVASPAVSLPTSAPNSTSAA